MDHAELRALRLFDGLDDAQLADLLAAASEEVTRRGQLLFDEGRPAVELVGAARGHRGAGPPGRYRGVGARLHDRARPVGRRVRRVGRVRGLLRHRAGREPRPRAPARQRRAAPALAAVVPLRAALHRRTGQHGAQDRVHRPPARGPRGPGHAVGGSGARAEQPGIRGDPRGRRPARHHRAGAVLARPARRRWHHGGGVHRARRPATPGERRGQRPGGTRRSPTGRTSCPTGSPTTTSTATG